MTWNSTSGGEREPRMVPGSGGAEGRGDGGDFDAGSSAGGAPLV